MYNSSIYLLTASQQDGTTSDWQWSLFGNNGNSAPTPPESSGDKIVSDGLEIIKRMEGGNTINNNSGWFAYATIFIRVAIALMLVYLAISLVVQGMQLAQYGDNPGMRSKTLDNIKRTIISIIILGGIETIIGLCFRIFA